MHPLVQLAKSSVENYIKKKEIITPPPDFPQEYLKNKSGVFVTIMLQKKLKGCIGTYSPAQENIAEELIENAISAATQDYRFRAIQEKELPLLSYAVYILQEPEIIKDVKDLNPEIYGIIVKSVPLPFFEKKDAIFDNFPKSKSGLLLPGLEEIDKPKDQILIACQKAGIDPEKEQIIIYRFRAEKFEQNND